MDKKSIVKHNYSKKKNNSIKWIVGSLAGIAVVGGSVVVPILGSGNSKGVYSWDNLVKVFNENLQNWVDDSANLGTKFDYKRISSGNIRNVYATQLANFIREQYSNLTGLSTEDFSIDIKPIIGKDTFDPNLPENYGVLPIRIYSNNSTNQKIFFLKGFAFSNAEFYKIFKSEILNEYETKIIDVLPAFPYKKEVEFSIPSYIDEGVKQVKVVGIGKEAMPNLVLKTLNIPNTITRIEDYAFIGSKVENFNFPNTLSFLGNNPFLDNKDNYILNFNNNHKFTTLDNQFLIDNETNKIITFLPNSSSFAIPNNVLEIGDSAAKNLPIKSITFGNNTNITTISNSAFQGITELSSFSLPSNVQQIGESAFRGSSIQQFFVPKDNSSKVSKLIRIGDYAFADCKNLVGELFNNKNLFYIPNSTISVEGVKLFENSPLIDVVSLSFSNFIEKSYNAQFNNIITSTTNPKGTTLTARLDEELEKGTILNNEKFKEIFGNQLPSSFIAAKDQSNAGEGFVVEKNIVLPAIDSTKTFNDLIIPEFVYWQEQGKNPTIYRITEIPTAAFENSTKIQNMTLPKSIVEIGNNAFKGSNLSKIHFSAGSNFKLIGDEAFANTKIKEVDLSLTLTTEATTTFGSNVFANNTLLSNVIWNPKYKDIPRNMFLNSTLLSNFDFVSNKIQTIGEGAFSNTSLVNVSFNDSISFIGQSAFSNNKKLKTLSFDNSSKLTNILDNTFNGCSSLDTINSWPTQLISIGNSAFNSIAIQNLINLPSTLNVVGNNAFSNNANLLKVVLPVNVSTLGNSVFENDTALNDLIIPESTISVGNNVLNNCSSLKDVFISYEQYYGPYKVSVKEKLEIGKLPTTNIYYQQLIDEKSDFEFTKDTAKQTVIIKKYKGSSKNVFVPEFVRFSDNKNIAYRVVGIGENAFKDSSTIMNLSLPNSIKEIGNNAFENTTALVQLDLSQTTITSLPENAFRSSGVLNVELPNSLTTINASAFENAKKLSTINLSNVTTINERAFKNASSLFNINSFSKKLTAIKASVFEGTSSLQLDGIPNTITSIGSDAFSNSRFSVEELVIPNSVSSIGERAFKGLNFVKSIKFEDNNKSLTTISPYAFSELKNLESFDISNTKIATLGNFALTNNANLVNIKLASSIKTLGDSVFERCSKLVNLSLPTTIVNIGRSIAKDCPNIKFVIITPMQMLDSTIMDNLNDNKGTSTYRVVSRIGTPGSEISTEDFIVQIVEGQGIITGYNNRNATQINVPEFVQSSFSGDIVPISAIAPNAFANMPGLETLNLSSNLIYIGSDAFKSAINLTTVNIPNDNSLEEIGNSAFESCAKLTSISAAPNLKSIGHSAFRFTKLSNLDLIATSKNLETIGNLAFESTLISGTIDGSLWKKLQVVGTKAFANTQISSIDMTNSAANINFLDYSFANMTNLTTFKFNLETKTIPLGMFANSSKLVTVEWPNNVEIIASHAFENTAINTWPGAAKFTKLKVIDSYAFKNTRLTEIDLTGATLIESIRKYAFADMPSLITVNMPDASNKYAILESDTFLNNPELVNIVLPSTIKTISNNAFNNLAKIEQVLIPSGVSFMDANSFKNLPKLKRIGIQMNQNESLISLQQFLTQTFNDMFVYVVKENEQSNGTNLFDIQFNGNDATLVSYTGNSSKVYIPSYVVNNSGLWIKVTDVNSNVFQTKKDIIQEVIMDSKLDDFNAGSLFQDLANLVSVTLSEKQTLYGSMFKNTPKLKTVIIKNKNITQIPGSCFFGSGIEDLDLSEFNKITSLAIYCFEKSQITNIKLPSSINEFRERVFADATKLTSFDLVVDGDVNIGDGAFDSTPNLVSFSIQPKNKKTGTITLGSRAFKNSFVAKFDFSNFNKLNLSGSNIFDKCFNTRELWLGQNVEANSIDWVYGFIYDNGVKYKVKLAYSINHYNATTIRNTLKLSDDQANRWFNWYTYNI